MRRRSHRIGPCELACVLQTSMTAHVLQTTLKIDEWFVFFPESVIQEDDEH
jgi:hypothetical protein